jgi:hypothetical protein
MGAQCFNFAPDGGVMFWISARWGHNASILHLLAVQCFGLAPNDGAILQFFA